MKIIKIERQKNDRDIFLVTFRPNYIEKVFGVVDKIKKFKDGDEYYTCGGARVYLSENEDRIGNFDSTGAAIDKFRRKFQ